MARSAVTHVCQQCGARSLKWAGKCEDCGAWNTLVEERKEAPSGIGNRLAGRRITFEQLQIDSRAAPPPRMRSGISEFDRVSGGGLVPGSATLIGGDPGIGKSTLLLQLTCKLSGLGHKAAYISGEESADQVRMRAQRLGLAKAAVDLGTATNASDIVASMDGPDKPDVMVIDSIQTMFLPNLDSAPGTVSQVRASAQELIRAAKNNQVALLIVGHVTKDGAIAGPRVLEHMVDAVLYFEGDKSHHFRVLRSVKKTALVQLTKSAFSKWLKLALPKYRTRPSCFSLTVVKTLPAQLCLPALREVDRFLLKLKHWLHHHHSQHHAAMLWGGTPVVSQC